MKVTKVLSFLCILACSAVVVRLVSAMTFQDSVDVQFTFGETLSLSLSSSVIRIDNLLPGNYDKSNTISVNVDTNSVHGYTLSAKVGGTGQTAANSSLVNTAAGAAFNSIGTNVALTLANLGDNTWGYTTASTINNSTTYSGLAYNDYKVINVTKSRSGTAFENYPGTNSTSFTIGAKASSDQLSGIYSNVITFTAVSNVSAPPVCNPSGKTIASIVCMQDINSNNGYAVFKSMEVGVQYQLYDSRDQKKYYVSKLEDGNVWMTQNLDLDIDSSKTYTPADTDIPANWTPSTSTYATGVTAWNYSTTSPESYDPGNLCWNGVLDESWGTTLDNGTTACIDGSNMNYHIGNYYNWTAAVAMNDSSSYYTQNQDVNQSICPAGWMLPKSGTVQTGSGSFLYLKDQLSLTSGTSGNIQNSPVYFTYGGNWYGGSWYVDSVGYYWSSVVDGSDSSYNLFFEAGGYLDPQFGNFSGNGYSVRCVARPQEPISINSLTYMQDFANLTNDEKRLVLNSMTTGQQYQLRDSRDEKTYYISKLQDGNVWMTQNLDLDLDSSTMYTPTDTDIRTNWTPSVSTYTTDMYETWNKSKTILESYDPGDRCWNSQEITTTTGTSLEEGTTTCDDDNMYYNRHFHIGNYYNWTAIVAMNDSSAYNSIDTDVDQSICPAGWMLPKSNATITTSGSFRYFRDRLTLVSGRVNWGGNASLSPVYLAYSGGWVGNGAWGIGSSGYYWSSVVDSADYVYSLYIGGDGHLSVKSQSGRDSGLSARCVLRLERNSIEDIAYMQDFSGLTSTEKASVLSSMTTNAQYQLRDSRDEKTYYISKLQDGNVWMTQNLDLDLKTSDYGGVGFVARFNPNSGNTDLNEYATSGYTDGYVCTGTKADCSNGIIAWVPENNTIGGPSNLNSTNWVNDVNNPYSYDPGAGDSVDPSGSADGHRLTGNYYNWTAAIASNDSSNFNSSTDSDVSSNPKNSVCPKGWRLPTISNQSGNIAGSTNEFARLNALYNGGSGSGVSNLVNTPLYLARSGVIYGGALKGAGAYGDYWSSTVSSGDYAYFLYFTTESGQDYINTANRFDRRHRGYSVRCVAR